MHLCALLRSTLLHLWIYVTAVIFVIMTLQYTVSSIIVIFSGRFFDLRFLWWPGEMSHSFLLQRIWVQLWTPPLQLTTVSSGAFCFAGTCIQVEHISSWRLTNIRIYENNKFSKMFAVTIWLWVSIWISELFFADQRRMLLKLWYKFYWICRLGLLV